MDEPTPPDAAPAEPSGPTSDALDALLAGLGPGWVRTAPGEAWRSEPGLVAAVGLNVDAEGRAAVRIEVRPIVGWPWYAVPVVAPLVCVMAGMDFVRAAIVGGIFLVGVRVIVARLILRPTVVARRTSLQADVARAMAALGGAPAGP